MYDYLLGGKDYFPPDREAAEKLIAAYPETRTLARANRRFLTRAVWYLAEHGIRQYIDLGTGLPTSPNVHEVARQVRPDAGSSTSTTTRWSPCTAGCCAPPMTGVAVVDGDIRVPRSILANPKLTADHRFDFSGRSRSCACQCSISSARTRIRARSWPRSAGAWPRVATSSCRTRRPMTPSGMCSPTSKPSTTGDRPRGTTVRGRDPRLLHRAGTGRAGPGGRVPVAAGHASQGSEDPHPGRSGP